MCIMLMGSIDNVKAQNLFDADVSDALYQCNMLLDGCLSSNGRYALLGDKKTHLKRAYKLLLREEQLHRLDTIELQRYRYLLGKCAYIDGAIYNNQELHLKNYKQVALMWWASAAKIGFLHARDCYNQLNAGKRINFTLLPDHYDTKDIFTNQFAPYPVDSIHENMTYDFLSGDLDRLLLHAAANVNVEGEDDIASNIEGDSPAFIGTGEILLCQDIPTESKIVFAREAFAQRKQYVHIWRKLQKQGGAIGFSYSDYDYDFKEIIVKPSTSKWPGIPLVDIEATVIVERDDKPDISFVLKVYQACLSNTIPSLCYFKDADIVQ